MYCHRSLSNLSHFGTKEGILNSSCALLAHHGINLGSFYWRLIFRDKSLDSHSYSSLLASTGLRGQRWKACAVHTHTLIPVSIYPLRHEITGEWRWLHWHTHQWKIFKLHLDRVAPKASVPGVSRLNTAPCSHLSPPSQQVAPITPLLRPETHRKKFQDGWPMPFLKPNVKIYLQFLGEIVV